MKILILGAAGQIARMLTNELLDKTDHSIVLYARNGHKRLTMMDESREVIFDGDFKDKKKLIEAMKDVDFVYINDMGDHESTKTIIDAMHEVGVRRVIAASVLGIYDEVPGAFGEWNKRMISGTSRMTSQIESASLLENSNLDYTLLRLTWLYNQAGNTKYMITQKGEAFIGAQVTRQAVTQLIMDIIEEKSDKYIRTSLGVSEPDTDWAKHLHQ
ncbi:NAD(P)H-binding protein [Bacillus sp. ISL-40]|uniref:NAD(P)H-binding protein n=1 Tax=unclassified Bacillus (in: firmicutes) TaxID=185979 RepID=UPI001BEC0660|nr:MULTISPECIES: NAD(P)H-binding protein [unclassified Bacillus (in: firmicutes)]MBT2701469.1 NAD(P)H-binding protein [Bacillus sp. ISL-40]MBT2744653.1 NAD(P)H-binding protein [Bacillus sp. ISL-77]